MITCIHGNYENCCCRKCYAYHKDFGSPNCSKCHVERCPCVDLGLDKPNEAQCRANRYTIETLKPLNHSYHDRYRISQGDVNMVNILVNAIESNVSVK